MKHLKIIRTLRNPEKYAPLLAIRNKHEYDAAIAQLNRLVNEVGGHPKDPRYRFIDTLRVLIEAYAEKHHQISDVSVRGTAQVPDATAWLVAGRCARNRQSVSGS